MTDKVTNKNVTVGTSTVQVAQEVLETQRKEIFICNTSTGGQVITIAFNDDAVVGKGLVLSPGGSFSSSMDGSNFFPLHFQINAVSSGAGGTLAIVERIGKVQ